jgi:phenylacetate-CoA ligase
VLLHPRLRIRELKTFSNELKTLALTRKLESASTEKIMERKERLLRHIVDCAYRNVPFYRDIYSSLGIDPSSIRTVDDLRRLPVITKEDVRRNFPDRIVARGHDPETAFRSASSGTSGVRTTFLSDWSNRDVNFALIYRAKRLFGYRLGDMECQFAWWPRGNVKWFQRLGIERKTMIVITSPPAEALSRLLDLSPRSVLGSPSYLWTISSLPGADRLADMGTKYVFTTGELLDSGMRQRIGEAFDAPILDMYGSAEQNYISSECPEESNHHLNSVNLLLETVRDGEPVGPGERGDILITTLTNHAMPLIRYRIGDVGSIAPDECGCGRAGKIMESIEGRRDDFVVNRFGMEISPEALRRAVTRPRIEGYRIIQVNRSRIRVEIVDAGLSEKHEREVRGLIRGTMSDPEVEVEFERVERILSDPSGKRRLVISHA